LQIKLSSGRVGSAKAHQVGDDDAKTTGNFDAYLLPSLRRTGDAMQQEQRFTVTSHQKTQTSPASTV
jgi:hypothetical protein